MAGSTDGSKPLRAIVVEDEDDDALLLLRELKRSFDARCLHVSTPEALRAALADGPWDIVISDWALPTFNGLEAFRIVREVAGDLPFIIVSGTITEEAAVEALKAGVHDFMVKGRFARLAPAIERELREAETRREKRLAELDLERQRAETERSERLLRSVLQAVPDGVVVVDTAGRVVVWSAGADAIFKMPRADIELADWPRHYGIYLTDRMTLAGGGDQALVKALSGTEIDREERFLRNAQVKEAWLSVSARPLRASDGTITGAVGVFRDVTHERATQEQIMISDRMASVGMLAAGVAHEINNPLGAALLNLELLDEMLRREPARRDDADLRETTADARSAVARVREIVGDLRIFSRHEDPTAVQADVRSALESSLRMAFNEVRHRARVQKDYQPAPIVDGSEARLGQVFRTSSSTRPGDPEEHRREHDLASRDACARTPRARWSRGVRTRIGISAESPRTSSRRSRCAGATFDVIFSDLMMPQVTGMELYARIREEFPDHAPRVVFLTGGAFTQSARDFLARVPNPTLEKPIDRNGLLALVSERVKAPSLPPSKAGT